MKTNSSAAALRFTHRNLLLIILSLLLAFGMLLFFRFMLVRADNPPLSVEILTAYNLVVDSNVSSPSTYGPSLATVGVKFCNTNSAGGDSLYNVWGYIGDYVSGGTSTPGIYPTRSVDAGFISEHPELETSATYSFTHVGGSADLKDAERFIGTLAPSECSVQYWHFDYPKCEANDAPPCDGGMDPVWGAPTNPNDDLYLYFDSWATANVGSPSGSVETTDATRKLTMRNEISAMANKIEPNPNGRWFNTEDNTVNVGDVITSNGVLYTFGNVNKGFDNDGDGLFDYNAWAQPVGNANFDPSCFRLVRTSGVLTITRSGGNPPMIMNFTDQLYFENLPADNTNVVGNVYYTFLALNGVCTANLTPYQEAASGADNEKFNADYGTGVPPIMSYTPAVTLTKSGPSLITENSTFTYNIPFQNNSTMASAGLTLSTGGVNMPLMIEDSVPDGLQYACGSAEVTNFNYTYTSPGYKLLSSIDSGNTWIEGEPASCPGTNPTSNGPDNLVVLQWWLTDPLPKKSGTAPGATATFDAIISDTYISGGGSPVIENCAEASFGDSTTFETGCKTTLVRGSGQIGDFVWRDLDGDGVQDGSSETGIQDISVSLYWDANNDNTLDDGDLLLQTVDADSNGEYNFTDLPVGYYLVKVDYMDSDLPTGYSNTTPILLDVDLTSVGQDYNSADFGFAPTLKLDKVLVTPSPVREGSPVSFDIKLTNTRPASSNGFCTHYVWPTAETTGASPKNFNNDANILGAPDGAYADGDFSTGANKYIETSGYSINGDFGEITKVEAVLLNYISAALTDDYGVAQFIEGTAPLTTTTYTAAEINNFISRWNAGYLVWDLTDYAPGGSWGWNDFANLKLRLDEGKSGGSDPGNWYLDAWGFRVTTDQPCGGSDDVIAILPLTDTYDSTKLTFQSASITPNSTTPTGTLTWNNLGPLYGGQTLTVRVNFLSLDPGAIGPVSTNNTASVDGAKFGSGRSVNDANDIEPVGILRTAKIGDFIWFDTDGQGDYDAGSEYGWSGVTVRLCSNAACSATIYQTTTTNASGYYEFVEVDGTYFVVVTPPSGATLTYDPDGGANNYSQVAVSGADNLNQDFGYDVNRALIRGVVWEDNNGNGSQDLGENGFGGHTVQFCIAGSNCNGGNNLGTATVNTDGSYTSPLLPTGTSVEIRVSTPAGGPWTHNYETDGTTNGTITLTTPASGGMYPTPQNFAYRRTPASSTIGDTLFTDWDGDGVQDSGEEGILSVKVYLYEDANGNGIVDPDNDALIATQTTNSAGFYQFTGVPAGNYTIVVDKGTIPSGYVQTKDPDQSGICVICDSKDPITVDGTSSYPNEDFGYQPRGGSFIGDYVWNDANGDGVQDNNETGIPNITVRLYEDSDGDGIFESTSDDALIATTSTDSDGKYLFENLPYGRYWVDVDTADTDLPNDYLGFEYILSTNNDPKLVVLNASNPSDLIADFGFTAGSVIGDYTWNDADADGFQDPTEVGINGVTVLLYRDTDNDGAPDGSAIATQITANDPVTGKAGYYSFTRLPAGDYVVVIDPNEFSSGGTLYNYVGTYDPDAYDVPCIGTSATGCDTQSTIVDPTSAFGLSSGEIDMSNDFGFVLLPTGQIGDSVWVDFDSNGIYDEYESGISGASVQLWDCGLGTCSDGDELQVGSTQITNSNGNYLFTSVPANITYEVRVTGLPANYAQVYDPDGNLDAKTQVVLDASGRASSVGGTSCTAGDLTCALDADFGYRPTGTNSLGGTVFFDPNDDGSPYETGDLPIGGVTVYLYQCTDATCVTKSLFASTKTSTMGAYNFTNLPDSYYKVIVAENSPSLVSLTRTYEPDEQTDGDGDLYCGSGVFNNGSTPGCNNQNIANLTGGSMVITTNDYGYYGFMDCGDLPNSYNITRLSNEGPCHISINSASPPDHYLGNSVDYWDEDNDGAPDNNALGDDLFDGGDDEDGVFVDDADIITWTDQSTVQISVTVNGDNAYLAGWFDWNKDGNFVTPDFQGYDPGEYVYFGNLADGFSGNIDVNIPDIDACSDGVACWSNSDPLFARFRLYKGSSPPPVIGFTGNVINGEVEDYRWPEAPTAVTMADYAAYSGIGQITIRWQTAIELDALGFNLYRASSPDGQREQINPELIPSKAFGGLFGATYEFVDSDLPAGETYYYWLEFIDLEGKQVFGPMSATSNYGIYLPLVRH